MSSPCYYETDRALSEYLLFHYGAAEQVMAWPFGPADALDYPRRCVSELLDVSCLPAGARALDLGCAVGRSTFELARHCREVIGIDYSEQFIQTARELQKQSSLRYRYAEEGELAQSAVARVPMDVDRSRVMFERGDAQNLRQDLGSFEVVLLANLVDRLSNPRQCLEALASITRPGGQLIITTPCTWLDDYTPRDHWLGGRIHDGQPLRTLDALRDILKQQFELALVRDLPFLIREHARKFQWSVALATRWMRR